MMLGFLLLMVMGVGGQTGCADGDQQCLSVTPGILSTASDVQMVSGLVQSFVFVESTKRQGKRYRKSIMVTDAEVREFGAFNVLERRRCQPKF